MKFNNFLKLLTLSLIFTGFFSSMKISHKKKKSLNVFFKFNLDSKNKRSQERVSYSKHSQIHY